MKKALLLALIAIGIAVVAYQAKEVQNLRNQLSATESIIYQVKQDNEDYFFDVLAETDAYQNYLETL